MTELQNGEIKRDDNIKINYHGKEKVQGVEADKINIIGTGTDFIPKTQMWFNEDQVVKVTLEGEEIPAVMVNSFMNGALYNQFSPFVYLKKDDLAKINEFQTAKKSTKDRYLAGKNVEILEYNVQDLSSYGLRSGIISFADFKHFLLLESYQLTTMDKNRIDYQIKKIEFQN
mgnify:CR=1 FL=1